MDEQGASSVGPGVVESSQIKGHTIKAFFTQALEKPVHRNLVHQRVQELLSEDTTSFPEVIHLGHCGWEHVGQVQSPTYFVMYLCRKYSLLPSERSVLLTLSDQYQAIQLCLAKINKKKHGDFSAAVSDVLDVWNELYRDVVTASNVLSKSVTSCENDEGCEDLNLPSSRRQSHDPVVREMQEIVASYHEFLENSGCVDHFTVYTLLREHLKTNQELCEEVNSKVYIIEGVNHMPAMERELLKLLLSNAQLVKVSVSLSLSSSFSSGNDLDMSGIGDGYLNTSETSDKAEDQESTEMDKTNQETESDSLPSIDTESLESTVHDFLDDLSSTPGSVDFTESELYIEQLIVCHLRLLINTRDELALAVLCSMPGREITQQGFHDIKEEAQRKNMPMYQTIFSFVMRLRLGGKGYQSDPNCPMLQHSKPLGEFVDSIMKLQNIVEEESNAMKGAIKVLTLIKSGLMRIRGRSIKGACIEKVWDSLNTAFKNLTNQLEEGGASEDSDKTLKVQQTTGALRPCLKLLVKLIDEASGRIVEEIVDVLGDNFLTQCNSSKKTATPIRIPSVLSLFRSPVDGASTFNPNKLDDEVESSLRMRLLKNKSFTPRNNDAPRFQSSCSWAPDDLSPIHKGDGALDKTISPVVGPTLKAVGNKRKSNEDWKEIVDAVTKEEELRSQDSTPTRKQEKKSDEKRSKRSLLSDISNIASDPLKTSKPRNTSKKPPTKKGSKALPVAKGQKSITSFFQK